MTTRHALIAAACGLLILSCGSSTNSNPTPVQTPTPVAVATPTPLPDVSQGCGLPPKPDLHTECPRLEPGQYAGQVSDAIHTLFTTRPELFDFNDTKGNGLYSYKVLDRRAYTRAVVLQVRQYGLCSTDEKEEIAVKQTQDFNEQYNVWTSDGYVRLPPGAYVSTCFPAQF